MASAATRFDWIYEGVMRCREAAIDNEIRINRIGIPGEKKSETFLERAALKVRRKTKCLIGLK